MFQAAARNYDLTLKIGYPRLPIIHMDYPQLSPLQMEILSEKPPCFYLRRQEQVRGLVQIQSSCCAFAALQEDGSVISWGHPSMPQKMAEFAESMILFFWLIFPIFSWEIHGNPLGTPWRIDGFRGDFVLFFFWGVPGSAKSKDNGRKIDAVSCPAKPRHGHPVVFPCLCSAVERWECHYLGQQGLWRRSLELLEFLV